ncbi:MAG: hypothetical protein M1825_004309 [Sarcosagium campestre]|nr:MAG: hypothetical protein M1825_004309 [Sarcosagium campestre]
MDLSLLKGDTGMFTCQQSDQLSTLCTLYADPSNPICFDSATDNNLHTALNNAVLDAEREDLLSENLRLYPDLVREIEPVLDARLRARHVTRDFYYLSVAEKIARLAESPVQTEHRAAAADRFEVALMTIAEPTGNEKTSQKLYFQMDDRFGTFQGVLRGLTQTSAELLGHDGGYTLADGPWKVRILDAAYDEVRDVPKREISNEKSYRAIVQRLKGARRTLIIWHSQQDYYIRKRSAQHDASESSEEKGQIRYTVVDDDDWSDLDMEQWDTPVGPNTN